MKTLTLALLVLLASPLTAQTPTLQGWQHGLLDTATTVMGHTPDSIVVRCYPGKRGRTIGNVITLCDPRDTEALLHELGHFWSAKENITSYEAADSLHLDLDRAQGVERIADIYADLLRARMGRIPNNAADSDLLQRLLTRVVARQE